MEKVIEKDLLSYLLRLEKDQQRLVRKYIQELLEQQEMSERALKAEEDIAEGRVKTSEEFKQEAEAWIQNKTTTR